MQFFENLSIKEFSKIDLQLPKLCEVMTPNQVSCFSRHSV